MCNREGALNETCPIIWTNHAVERLWHRSENPKLAPEDVEDELVGLLCGRGRVKKEVRMVRFKQLQLTCVWEDDGWIVVTVLKVRKRSKRQRKVGQSKRRRDAEDEV